MRHRTGYGALAAVALLAVTGWTTKPMSGSNQDSFSFATTGTVVPDSAQSGLPYISVADLAGTGAATFWVYSEDAGTADSMLVTLDAGSAWDSYYPHGVDSVVVVTNATTLGFHLSN